MSAIHHYRYPVCLHPRNVPVIYRQVLVTESGTTFCKNDLIVMAFLIFLQQTSWTITFKNCPFFTFTILPVSAAAINRSVCRHKNAGICKHINIDAAAGGCIVMGMNI